jgi:membrane peptidoglycan carboxypeptidase
MMETVVSASGTGRRAALAGLRVAGKTGTAQKLDLGSGRYSQKDYLAWFIGVVPADDPALAIAVVVDEPQGPAHGGGDAAAPLFAQVASAQLAHLGIVTSPHPIRSEPFRTLIAEHEPAPSQRTARIDERRPASAAAVVARTTRPAPGPPPVAAAPPPLAVPAAARARSPESVARTFLVPDFRGETVDSAVRMAADDALVLELVGDRRGLAVEQHPEPGTVLTGDQPRVRLRFALDPRHREEG